MWSNRCHFYLSTSLVHIHTYTHTHTHRFFPALLNSITHTHIHTHTHTGSRNVIGGKDGGRSAQSSGPSQINKLAEKRKERLAAVGGGGAMGRQCKICKTRVDMQKHYCNSCAYKKVRVCMCVCVCMCVSLRMKGRSKQGKKKAIVLTNTYTHTHTHTQPTGHLFHVWAQDLGHVQIQDEHQINWGKKCVCVCVHL